MEGCGCATAESNPVVENLTQGSAAHSIFEGQMTGQLAVSVWFSCLHKCVVRKRKGRKSVGTKAVQLIREGTRQPASRDPKKMVVVVAS